MGSLSLLQGIFPTQGLNPGLPHCRQILHQLSHQGSPRILEWIALVSIVELIDLASNYIEGRALRQDGVLQCVSLAGNRVALITAVSPELKTCFH